MQKNRILITNRGPDFTSGNHIHKGIGGTKDAYALLMDHFCNQWFCLVSEDMNGGSVKSNFGDALKVCFIEKENYQDYYYKFVSECLYPTLLGYSDRAISLGSYPVFSQVSEFIAKNIESLEGDLILCDYHLFKIPALIQRECKKSFFWFIPFLTRQYYSPIFEEIVGSLSKCDEIFFLNEEYAMNFKTAFRWYFPNEPLMTKVHSLVLGPNDDFSRGENIVVENYHSLLRSVFGIDDIKGKKFLLSVSRMDFVKNLPLLIEGYSSYRQEYKGSDDLHLLLIAPHHRKDSSIYKAEENRIQETIAKSEHKDSIHITHEHLSLDVLRKLYAYADLFACTSVFDGMPLTPLEYVLANKNSGAVILSDTIGSYNLLFPNSFGFQTNNSKSLAMAIDQAMKTPMENRKNRIEAMRNKVNEISLEKWLHRLLDIFSVSYIQ